MPEEGLLDDLHASHVLLSTRFTAVGYGTVRETRKGAFDSILDNTERRFAVQKPLSLTTAWFTLSMNEATGNGGTCYGDSGGPHFLGAGETETNVVVSITVTGDTVCKATDTTYRVETASARDFLGNFVPLPLEVDSAGPPTSATGFIPWVPDWVTGLTLPRSPFSGAEWALGGSCRWSGATSSVIVDESAAIGIALLAGAFSRLMPRRLFSGDEFRRTLPSQLEKYSLPMTSTVALTRRWLRCRRRSPPCPHYEP